MRMNTLMRQLLDKLGASLPRALDEASPERIPLMVTVEGSVLLADQERGSRSVSIQDFPDRTGYECFVNHYHIRYDGSHAALRQLVTEIAGVRKSLLEYAPDRGFLIIVSISGGECTIRFHERRPGEAWLAGDLEGYTEDAVAAISVGHATDC